MKKYKIDAIYSSILTQSEIKRRAVCEIDEHKLYEKNMQKSNGLHDHRMGSMETRIVCGTCNNGMECPGHEAMIVLPCPIYNPCFKDEVLKLLRIVCFYCSACTVQWNHPRIQDIVETQTGMDRFNEISSFYSKQKSKISCPQCQARKPQYKSSPLWIDIDWTDIEPENQEEMQKQREIFTPSTAMDILQNITDQDLKKIGFCLSVSDFNSSIDIRPEDMLIQYFPVPPPCIRPALMESVGSKTRGQDDLTHMLQTIIKTSNKIKILTEQEYATRNQKKNIDQNILFEDIDILERHEYLKSVPIDLIKKLQHSCTTFINNNIKGVKKSTQRSGAPNKGVLQRLHGKEGRVRGTVVGKRVDYCVRGVITPDPNLPPNHVGIPTSVALKLTYSETVNNINIGKLKHAIEIGAGRLDGARAVVNKNGNKITLEGMSEEDRAKINLEIGMKVLRYVRNGDVGLLNRQPSLHKSSIMGHMIKIMPHGNTIRFNEINVTPYNADFDGDEMNLHIVQNELARAEAMHLMFMPTQIRSGQNNRPQIGLIQDCVYAAYLFTQKNRFLDKETAMQLLYQVPFPPVEESLFYSLPIPAILKPKPLWTGKQLFSKLLDKTLFVERAVRGGPQRSAKNEPLDSLIDWEEKMVIIKNGELLTGSLCKSMIGREPGGIVDTMMLNCNDAHTKTHNFLFNAQRMLRWFIDKKGFSVKLSDCLNTKEENEKIHFAIMKASEEIKRLKNNKVPGVSAAEIEEYCLRIGNSPFDYANSVLKVSNTPLNNDILGMIESGSKGTALNFAQIKACVAQQAIQGTRIGINGNRTLPMFKNGDHSAESNGYVTSSYNQGLKPAEFYFHTMGGREGLTDTAVKTSHSGYIQRKMAKTMESLRVCYDYSVRRSNGDIVQFVYGGDALDSIKQQRVPFVSLELDLSSIFDSYFDKNKKSMRIEYEKQDLPLIPWLKSMNTSTMKKLSMDPGKLNMFLKLIQSRERVLRKASNSLVTQCEKYTYLTFNIFDLLNSIQDPGSSQITPTELDNMIDGTIKLMKEKTNPFIVFEYIELHIREALHPKNIRNSSNQKLKHILDIVLEKYSKNLVTPGDCVGIHAADALGEPINQMTLNTFHFAGVSSKNVTLGVPRLEEIINVANKTRRPCVTVYLLKPFNRNLKTASVIARLLERTDLRRIVTHSSIIKNENCFSDEEEKVIHDFHQLFHCENKFQKSNLKLKLVLNKEECISLGLSPIHIVNSINTYIGDYGFCYSSDYNMKRWFIYITISIMNHILKPIMKCVNNPSAYEYSLLTSVKNSLLSNVIVSGIDGIQNCTVDEIVCNCYDQNNGKLVQQNEFVIYAICKSEQYMLNNIMKLDFVDKKRTYSNNVSEIYETLDIEAATQGIYQEVKSLMKFEGTYINDHHMLLIADVMTNKGYPKAMNRHHMKASSDISFLHRSSFEETADVFIKSTLNREHDIITDVTPSVFVGILPKVGTGFIDINNSNNDNIVTPSSKKIVRTLPFNNKTQNIEINEYEALFDPNSELLGTKRARELKCSRKFYEPRSKRLKPSSLGDNNHKRDDKSIFKPLF